MSKHFLEVWDLGREEIEAITERALRIKEGGVASKVLMGKSVGLLFLKPSTRTRVSFEVAINKLGGNALFLEGSSLQTSRGEEVKDTAKVLSSYLDCLIVRANHSFIHDLSKYSSITVINALSELSHPCQFLSDYLTLYETFKGEVKRINIVYVGDGNNVCNSLMVGCALLGLSLTVCTPPGYEPNSYYLKRSLELCKISGGRLELMREPREAVKGADVIYTDVWFSMGQERREEKLKAFKGFQVNEELLKFARDRVLVMHCLPAKKGEEISEGVFERFEDFIYRQSENKLYAHVALLEYLFKGNG